MPHELIKCVARRIGMRFFGISECSGEIVTSEYAIATLQGSSC